MQNVFDRTPHHRTISLNATYLVLFRNPRDASQVEHLVRQVFPTDSRRLTAAYKDATVDTAHSYLVMDFNQDTPDDFRLRNTLFPVWDFPHAFAYLWWEIARRLSSSLVQAPGIRGERWPRAPPGHRHRRGRREGPSQVSGRGVGQSQRQVSHRQSASTRTYCVCCQGQVLRRRVAYSTADWATLVWWGHWQSVLTTCYQGPCPSRPTNTGDWNATRPPSDVSQPITEASARGAVAGGPSHATGPFWCEEASWAVCSGSWLPSSPVP